MTGIAKNQLENARVSMISLGVADLVRSTKFYQDLGWEKSNKSQDSISFMIGRNVVIGLYGRAALAQDAGVENTPAGFSGIALVLNLHSPQEVDAFAVAVTDVGGKIVKAPQKVFWGGYSGYISDIDGHLWEIAHNPFVGFDAQGNLDLDGEMTT